MTRRLESALRPTVHIRSHGYGTRTCHLYSRQVLKIHLLPRE